MYPILNPRPFLRNQSSTKAESGTIGWRVEWMPRHTTDVPSARRHGRTQLGRFSPLAHT